MNMEQSRTCRRCKQDKPLDSYYAYNKTYCKACRTKMAMEDAARHPERRQAIGQRYYQNHKEQQKAVKTAYLAQAEIRESRKANAKVYRLQKRAEIDAYNAAWRAANPEKARAMYIKGAHVRRARLQGVEIESFNRIDVFARDGGRCQYCQAGLDLRNWHLDHDVPIWRGGPHTFSNSVASCQPCNTRKHTMTGDEFRVLLASEARLIPEGVLA